VPGKRTCETHPGVQQAAGTKKQVVQLQPVVEEALKLMRAPAGARPV